MKFRIIENIEDSTPRETATLDLLLTPLEGNTVEDIISALGNRDYYGEYLINTRNKKEVEQAIIKHFGPNLPTHKRPLEKKQGFPFPPKTREAMETLIKSFEGKPNLITPDMVKQGAVVIDVGCTKVGDKLLGDVDFDGLQGIASFITPVPGGVGPMTVACLLENTILAYEWLLAHNFQLD